MAGTDFVPRDSLTSTTVAPGTTPPVLSLTVPRTLPVVICAAAGRAANSSATRHAQTTLRVDLTIIELLPLTGADYRSTCKVRHVMGYKSLIGVTRPIRRVNRHFALRNMSLQCKTLPFFRVKTAHFSAPHLPFPAYTNAAVASTTRPHPPPPQSG